MYSTCIIYIHTHSHTYIYIMIIYDYIVHVNYKHNIHRHSLNMKATNSRFPTYHNPYEYSQVQCAVEDLEPFAKGHAQCAHFFVNPSWHQQSPAGFCEAPMILALSCVGSPQWQKLFRSYSVEKITLALLKSVSKSLT